jgi:hypothetical protein
MLGTSAACRRRLERRAPGLRRLGCQLRRTPASSSFDPCCGRQPPSPFHARGARRRRAGSRLPERAPRLGGHAALRRKAESARLSGRGLAYVLALAMVRLKGPRRSARDASRGFAPFLSRAAAQGDASWPRIRWSPRFAWAPRRQTGGGAIPPRRRRPCSRPRWRQARRRPCRQNGSPARISRPREALRCPELPSERWLP